MTMIAAKNNTVVDERLEIYQSGQTRTELLSMLVPTGRIQDKVIDLLGRIGLEVTRTGRSYKPSISSNGIQTKMLKAQNIPELVALGRHDCGFSGYDWIVERDADVVQLIDLGFDPVNIVAAIPEQLLALKDDRYAGLRRPLVVASEYRNLTQKYVNDNKLDAIFLQTFGATEALPPDDADMIVDNTATGCTLEQNRLVIVDEIMTSSTRFICNRKALESPSKRRMLEEMRMLMESCLRARDKVLLEMHVPLEDFDNIMRQLPCMKAPTVSRLYDEQGYAIKIAVANRDVPQLIPKLVALGAKDILEFKLEKIVV